MKLNKPKSIKIRTLYGQAYDLLKAIAKNKDYEMAYDDSVYAKELLKHIDDLENNWNELEKFLETQWKETQDIWYVKIINKMKEIKEE